MRYATIIAGGSGTRLWPMSRADLPKQLIPLFSGRSLLEIAVDRLQGFIPPERQILCTGEKYRRQIQRVLPEFVDERILGEPEGRDTLAAVGLPAAVAMREDPDAIIGVFTADHLIEPVEQFQRRVEVGYQLVEKHPNTLVTFGIGPAYAATGFGYVELGQPLEGFDQAYRTVRFVEKPDAKTAEEYVASGRAMEQRDVCLAGGDAARLHRALQARGPRRPDADRRRLDHAGAATCWSRSIRGWKRSAWTLP